MAKMSHYELTALNLKERLIADGNRIDIFKYVIDDGKDIDMTNMHELLISVNKSAKNIMIVIMLH